MEILILRKQGKSIKEICGLTGHYPRFRSRTASILLRGIDITWNIQCHLLTDWVNDKPLHGFSKNLKAPGRGYHSWQGLRRTRPDRMRPSRTLPDRMRPKPLPASDALPVIRNSGKLGFPDNAVPNCGFQVKGRMVVIAHTPRGEKIRIISMRKANDREQEIYQQRLETARRNE